MLPKTSAYVKSKQNGCVFFIEDDKLLKKV